MLHMFSNGCSKQVVHFWVHGAPKMRSFSGDANVHNLTRMHPSSTKPSPLCPRTTTPSPSPPRRCVGGPNPTSPSHLGLPPLPADRHDDGGVGCSHRPVAGLLPSPATVRPDHLPTGDVPIGAFCQGQGVGLQPHAATRPVRHRRSELLEAGPIWTEQRLRRRSPWGWGWQRNGASLEIDGFEPVPISLCTTQRGKWITKNWIFRWR
jgi:hypothetical protein